MDFKEDQQMADAVAMVRTFFGMPFAHFFMGYNKSRKIEKYLLDSEDSHAIEKAVYVPARRDTFLDLIEEYKPSQAVDIGSGYSELGLRLWIDYNLDVTETIKEPEILELKQEILQRARKELKTNFDGKHKLILLNVNDTEFREKLTKEVDVRKRTVVVNEGIQSYLSKKNYIELVTNIFNIFPECMYITNAHCSLNYTENQEEIIRGASGIKKIECYSEEEMLEILRNVGFTRFGRVNLKLREKTIGNITKREIETIVNQEGYGIYFGEK